jgi:hypothetical protein
MALSLMTQWLFNFVIARTVPIMLSNITYGTFLLFGGCSICCFLYAMICVPETAKVPLESIHKLFEQNIIRGAFMDNFPQHRRAKKLQETLSDDLGQKHESPENIVVTHVEQSFPGKQRYLSNFLVWFEFCLLICLTFFIFLFSISHLSFMSSILKISDLQHLLL